MPKNTMWANAEIALGSPITLEEFEEAFPPARRKLKTINDREGTSHGADYLAVLISEAVTQNRFSFLTRAIYAEKEPHPEARPFITHQQYITPACGNQQEAQKIERAE